MTEHTTNIRGFASFKEADAFRELLMHKDSYGLFGIYMDEEHELWCVMPKVALDAMNNFKEPVLPHKTLEARK